MSQRIYVPFMMFNARIVNMQHLWSPSMEYLGKKSDKPNYFITAVSQKTRANWWEEPLLAANWAAYDQLLQKSGMTPQHIQEWPIKDGDMPPEPGKNPAEWAKGHWVFGGSSSNPIKVEIVQNSNVVPLLAKVGVKPGDYVALGVSAAIKQNNPRAMKHFCNTVLFMSAGEEIAVGNSVSGAELMQHAQRQGLQVAGFSGAPGGFPGAGGPGNPHGAQVGPGSFVPNGLPNTFQPGGVPQQQGFVPPNGPGGFVPTPGNPAMASPFNPGQGAPPFGFGQHPQGHGPGQASTMTYPSNPGPR